MIEMFVVVFLFFTMKAFFRDLITVSYSFTWAHVPSHVLLLWFHIPSYFSCTSFSISLLLSLNLSISLLSSFTQSPFVFPHRAFLFFYQQRNSKKEPVLWQVFQIHTILYCTEANNWWRPAFLHLHSSIHTGSLPPLGAVHLSII